MFDQQPIHPGCVEIMSFDLHFYFEIELPVVVTYAFCVTIQYSWGLKLTNLKYFMRKTNKV